MNEKKHVSEDEKRKSFLIYILLGILGAIILTILVLIMIPQLKKITSKPKVQNTTKNVVKKVMESSSKEKEIYRDKNKVNISIKQDTLTTDSAVIVITDTNENKFSWTQLYKIQKKVNNKWQDVELLSAGDLLLPKEYYDNETGMMEQSLVWTEKYGSLGVGQYRIVKEAERMEFYVEFEIQ